MQLPSLPVQFEWLKYHVGAKTGEGSDVELAEGYRLVIISQKLRFYAADCFSLLFAPTLYGLLVDIGLSTGLAF